MAGHSDLEMTGEYTFVTPERQNELTRRIQQKLAEATKRRGEDSDVPTPSAPSAPEVPQNLAATAPASTLVQ
jgi:hypothetical protein